MGALILMLVLFLFPIIISKLPKLADDVKKANTGEGEIKLWMLVVLLILVIIVFAMGS